MDTLRTISLSPSEWIAQGDSIAPAPEAVRVTLTGRPRWVSRGDLVWLDGDGARFPLADVLARAEDGLAVAAILLALRWPHCSFELPTAGWR